MPPSDPRASDPLASDARWPAPRDDDPFAAVTPRGRVVVPATIEGGVEPLHVTAILGHRELREAARDHATFSSDSPMRVPLPHEVGVRDYPQLPLESDPPLHGRYRALMAGALDRHRVESFAPAVGRHVDALIEWVLERTTCEVVGDLAVPAFTHALALVAGRPSDEDRWARWGKLVYTADAANPDFDAYLDEVLAEMDASPGDDVFGDLARARIDDRPLTRTERRGLVGLFLAAGRDTTVDGLAGALYVLGRSPRLWSAVVRDPSLLDAGVDELLRHVTPLPQIGRRATRTTRVGGREIAAGSWVSLAFRHANHDERAFPDPGRCVLDRRPNPHVAFGYGPHTCLGMHLALLVIRSVLLSLARVGRTLEVRDVTWEPWLDLGFDRIPHGIERLTLRVGDPI